MFARTSKSKPKAGRLNRRHRLQLQALESRRCLAYADLELRILEDNDGQVGAPLAENVLESGEAYWVEIQVQENHPFQSGLRTVGTDVAWDASLLDVIESDFSPETQLSEHLPEWRGGDLDNDAGTISDLRGRNGGSALTNDFIGDGELETFMQFRITAEQPGQGNIALSPSRFAISPERAASWSNSRISFGSLSYEVVAAASEPLAVTESASLEAPLATPEPVALSIIAASTDTVAAQSIVEPLVAFEDEPTNTDETTTEETNDNDGESTMELVDQHQFCTVVVVGVPSEAVQELVTTSSASFVFIASAEDMGPLIPEDFVRAVQTAIPWLEVTSDEEDAVALF